MAKKKTVTIPQTEDKSVFGSLITHWLGLSGILIALSLFLFSQDSAQIKITLFYIACIGASAFWLNGLIKEKRNIFNSFNFTLLFPFLLYFVYVAGSFFFHPYIPARLGSLVRFSCFSMLFLISAFNFNYEKADKFFTFLIAALWGVCSYGLLQIVDRFIFSGVDLLIWTDFFHDRIFSTISNPNFLADFCLFGFFIVLGRFLFKPSKSLGALLILISLNIAFTQSKGAWLALAASAASFTLLYLNFFSEKYKNHRLKYNLAVAAVLAAGILVAGIFTAKRMQSVNFRLSTWRSAVEMVEATPLTGMGKGSFTYIYPAYKRPEIFYMEGLHNVETQHAENYILEQSCELGLIGLGLYLMLVIWQILGFIKQIKLKSKLGAPDRETFILLSCFFASASIYLHNLVDVSIYFVSTSYFLAIFNGILFALNFGPLRQKSSGVPAPSKNIFFKLTYFILLSVIIALAYLFIRDFYEMTSPALEDKIRYFILYWIFFLPSIFYTAWLLLKEAFKSKLVLNVCLFTLAAVLMYIAYLPLRADFYMAAAAGMASRLSPGAPSYYHKALRFKPLVPSLWQFSGIAFQNRADLSKTNRPYEGDPAEGLYNDYDRALSAYKKSLSFIPNDTLIHYNLGSLYHDMAKQAFRKGDLKLSQEYYNLSETSLKKSLLLDPVHDNTYYHLANIALEHNDYRRAANWLNLYIQGPEEVVNPLYISKHRNNQKALTHLKNIKAIGGL